MATGEHRQKQSIIRLCIIVCLFLLSVPLSVSTLMAQVTPAPNTCRLYATFDGTYTITTPTGQITVPHTISILENVVVIEGLINETITLPITAEIPLAGSVTGTFTGVLTANVINHITGEIAGNFTGTGTGITALGQPVTGNINAVVIGRIDCKKKDEFQSNCGAKLNCSYDIQYLYDFCIEGKIKKICTSNPLLLCDTLIKSATHTDGVDDCNPTKAQLPIRPLVTGYSKGMEYFYHYTQIVGPNHTAVTPLFGNGREDYPDHYHNIFDMEVYEACEKWNCVCGFQGPYAGATGTPIKIAFSDNPGFFPNPARNAGVAHNNDSVVVYDHPDGSQSCNRNFNKAQVYFNSTPDFLYGQRDFPANKNTPFKKGWVGQNYIPFLEPFGLYPLPTDTNVLMVFSFMQVAIHEIGHLLGLNHYFDPNPPYREYCSKGTDGIMKPVVAEARNENMTELSEDDKCMFAKLYCPDLVIGIHELPVRPKIEIIPNPTTGEVNISFEIKEGMKLVTIEIFNEEGQLLKTLLSEEMYSEGTHNINSELNFPTGIYFMWIKMNKTIYTEQIIIAK